MQIPIANPAPLSVTADYAISESRFTGVNPVIDSQIQIVDLFAGAGGLSEGFATFELIPGYRPFRVIASVEKDDAACQTLRLRRFYHHLLQAGNRQALETYYAYVHGNRNSPVDHTCQATRSAWQEAKNEVLERVLGERETTSILRERIEKARIDSRNRLIVIGGPPCQAYSSVGRARNVGIDSYRPELDRRHFLYRTYLDLLRDHEPAAFVMENVKGILSSRIGGQRLFPYILQDLTSPAASSQDRRHAHLRYRIYSLINGRSFRYGQNAQRVLPNSF